MPQLNSLILSETCSVSFQEKACNVFVIISCEWLWTRLNEKGARLSMTVCSMAWTAQVQTQSLMMAQ
jgi:hypothetical protein